MFHSRCFEVLSTNRRLRILYVEDNEFEREFLDLLFFRSNQDRLQIDPASTLAEALTMLEDTEFDMVLLDLQLPDSDGIEGARRLLARFPLVPVVVLSGIRDDQAIRIALESGVHDYLIKGDFTHKALYRVISHAVQRGRYRKEIHRIEGELKVANEELRTLHAKAEAASTAKSRFLANISHEIRTPLNGIIGMADALAETDLSESQLKYVEVFQRSGSHLLELINQVLDLARIESDESPTESVPFSIHEVISEVTAWAESACLLKNLQFTPEASDGKFPMVRGDRKGLRQILFNLLGNAIKFTPQGKVSLKVAQAPPSDDGGDWIPIRFEVLDTGIGIPSDKQSRIFEPFTQADSTITRQFGGSGLGLTICKQITKSLGGILEMESELGRGSVFRLSLSFARWTPPEDRVAVPVAPTREITSLPPDSKILIVEDIEDNRFVYQAYFKGSPCEIVFAEDGEQALELLKTRVFDAVCMDVQMPKMDGYSATMALRAHESSIGSVRTPVIALTAHALEGESDKALAAGCDACLSKPIRKRELFAELHRHLSIGATKGAHS